MYSIRTKKVEHTIIVEESFKDIYNNFTMADKYLKRMHFERKHYILDVFLHFILQAKALKMLLLVTV